MLIELIIFVGAAALVALIYYELKSKKQNYPYEIQIEAALLPYVYKAIMFAYKSSESRMDEFQSRLQALPKRQLAVKIYSLLPSTIQVGDWTIETRFIKSIVSEKRFAEMIEEAFDGFGDWYKLMWDGYSGELLELINVDKSVGLSS